MPTGRDVHIDTAMSNLAVSAFSTGEDDFIADRLFPSIPVGKQSDVYYILEKGNFLRSGNYYRAPKTRARRIEFTITSETYFAKNYAAATDTALEDLANADTAVNFRPNNTMLLTSQLRRAQEIRVANLVTSISNVGSGVQLAGTNRWSDAVDSDPMADVTTGHAFIRQNTGLVANTAVIDSDTLAIVRRHPKLLDMFKFTSGGELSNDQIASVFKVQNLWEAQGVRENALQNATSSMTNIWGNNVLLAHIGAATGLQSRTLGLRFGWQPAGFPAAFQVMVSVDDEAGGKHSETMELGHFQDEKVVARELGYLINSTI